MTAETSNARGEVKVGDRVRATRDGSSYYRNGDYGTVLTIDRDGDFWVRWDNPIVPDPGHGWCIHPHNCALAAPPPADARGDVWGLVAKLAAHVRPTCSELWNEAQAFLAAEGVQAGEVAADAEQRGGGEVVARGFYDPMTGAYSESQHTPRWLPAVVCTAPPSAPVGVELSALRVQEWLHREHDILCPVQEIEQAMRTPCSCPFTERALSQQPAAVDEAAAIRAFEEHFEASAEDPSFEGELELWLTAWRKALAAQQQGGAE